MFQKEKNIFFLFSSLVITIITVITLSLLNEKIWLISFTIWSFIVTLHRLIKRVTNLKKDSNNKENEWFYLTLNLTLNINAPFIIFIDIFPFLIIWLFLYAIVLWYWAKETENTKPIISEETRIKMTEEKELIKLKKKRDKKYGKINKS